MDTLIGHKKNSTRSGEGELINWTQRWIEETVCRYSDSLSTKSKRLGRIIFEKIDSLFWKAIPSGCGTVNYVVQKCLVLLPVLLTSLLFETEISESPIRS